MEDYILETKGLCKYFGPTTANDHIDFSVKRGEIRGLAGENGSGKSTLLQQIAGIYHKDEGTILLNGKEYDPKNSLDAMQNKIGIVVQELGCLNNLPAGINVFTGHLDRFKQGKVLNIKAINKEAEALFEQYGLMKVPFNKECGTMNIESRKMVELARALSIDPDILILDEVTQSLSQNNREMLLGLIKKLQQEGKTIIIITHDLEEMIQVCDSISVLRDGKLVETCDCDGLTVDRIKSIMVGREISGEYYRTDDTPDYEEEVVLKCDHVTGPGVEDVSFELHKGEILGFCGLSDSGIHDLGKIVFGIEKAEKGSVTLPEKNVVINSIKAASTHAVAYVPKDRDTEALMISDSIAANFALPSLDELQGKSIILNPAKIRKLSRSGIDEYNVKCNGYAQHMDGLSGGNKQKVNLGRWLIKDLDVIILDCPTRGVDVSVKAYIYHVMQQAKKKGLSMILISDELPEVLGMSDRLVVMKDGRVQGEFLRGENFNQKALIEVMV